MNMDDTFFSDMISDSINAIIVDKPETSREELRRTALMTVVRLMRKFCPAAESRTYQGYVAVDYHTRLLLYETPWLSHPAIFHKCRLVLARIVHDICELITEQKK
jgi:hypothetical protein